MSDIFFSLDESVTRMQARRHFIECHIKKSHVTIQATSESEETEPKCLLRDDNHIDLSYREDRSHLPNATRRGTCGLHAELHARQSAPPINPLHIARFICHNMEINIRPLINR